ncbi:MAG: hypothetical protein DBY00_02010 [Flavobacteriales bacterium]|nr:MAG: hypothetical protein DBY00_02010 [Flavobacteriales bacterium]
MKYYKNILLSIFFMLAAVVAITASRTQKPEMSDLILANIEALADEENPDHPGVDIECNREPPGKCWLSVIGVDYQPTNYCIYFGFDFRFMRWSLDMVII